MTRTAISPRFAIRSFTGLIVVGSRGSRHKAHPKLESAQRLPSVVPRAAAKTIHHRAHFADPRRHGDHRGRGPDWAVCGEPACGRASSCRAQRGTTNSAAAILISCLRREYCRFRSRLDLDALSTVSVFIRVIRGFSSLRASVFLRASVLKTSSRKQATPLNLPRAGCCRASSAGSCRALSRDRRARQSTSRASGAGG